MEPSEMKPSESTKTETSQPTPQPVKKPFVLTIWMRILLQAVTMIAIWGVVQIVNLFNTDLSLPVVMQLDQIKATSIGHNVLSY